MVITTWKEKNTRNESTKRQIQQRGECTYLIGRASLDNGAGGRDGDGDIWPGERKSELKSRLAKSGDSRQNKTLTGGGEAC